MVKTMSKSKNQRIKRIIARHPVQRAYGNQVIEGIMGVVLASTFRPNTIIDARRRNSAAWLGGAPSEAIASSVNLQGKRIYLHTIKQIPGVTQFTYSVLTDRWD